jgi:SagB-type dehydrogenase family enzyme
MLAKSRSRTSLLISPNAVSERIAFLIPGEALLSTTIRELLAIRRYYVGDSLARSPMTLNRNLEATWKYHDATKQSYASVHNNLHFLDWANQPLPFKAYTALEPLALPREVRQIGVAALSAISESIHLGSCVVPDLEALAQLLYLTAGITRHRKYPSGDIYFRAAACTGALYEVELYVVCGNLVDLEAGVYHFAPAEFALSRLRAGDYRSVLSEATGGLTAIVHAPLTIICTCTYWRNALKYQARSYRHFGWDNGTLLANLLAVATALGMPAKMVCGFVDADVNRLLAVDPEREVAFSLVALGHVAALARQLPSELSALHLESVPLSRSETVYSAMREIHTASSLRSAKEVETWRGNAPLAKLPAPTGPTVPLHPYSDAEMPRDPIEQVILRRGSARKFAQVPIALPQLSTMLDRATRGIPADFLDPQGTHLNEVYLIVNAVEGLDPGAYVFHRDRNVLECLKTGNFRAQAGHLGLDQQLPAEAAADIFFLADLQMILERFGNRGYRAVQLEAGILSGKLYLGAYAQHVSATGLTFYDDEVIRFFSPHAYGKSVTMLVATGKNAKSLL